MLPQGFDPAAQIGPPRNELLEFAKAWVGTTIAFTLLYRNSDFTAYTSLTFVAITMAIAAGAGIILHELGHRVMARRFGSQAHFVANDQMLVISILLAFTGFLIAAPGAVWHRRLPKRETGIIAAAGPVVNIVLAAFFLIGLPLFNQLDNIYLWSICYFGYSINALLGVFNLIPLGPIDGAKILNWDLAVFIGLAAIGGLLFVLPYLAFAKDLFAFGF